MQASGTDDALAAAAISAPEQPQPEIRVEKRLPLPRKISYSSGQLVELVVGSMLNIFAMFYATAVCGVPGGLAGLALGAGLFVDAIMDPIIGSLSDNWNSRLGRRVPFMIAGLVPLILSFNLIFAMPAGLSTTGMFLWLMVLSVLLRISLSIFALPYQALGAELSDNYAERSSIAAWRWGIGIIGTIAVIGLGYGVFLSGPNGTSDRDAYLHLTLALSLLIGAGALPAIYTGLATRLQQREAAASTQALHNRLFSEMAEMLRNRTFVILFVSAVLTHVSQGINQALAMHVAIFFWKLKMESIQVMSIAAVVGFVLGAPLSMLLVARVEKRTMLIVGLLGSATFNSLATILRLFDLLPLEGAELTGILIMSILIGAVMFSFSVIALISIIPDAADEHEQLFGTRREGLFFAGSAFASKAASGAGLLFAGLVLELIHFPAKVADHATAIVAAPADSIAWLGFAGGPGAALLSVVSAIVVLSYRVDRKAHARIMAELNARRVA
jgi:GPH family glycoside/pentoside/hexuronide:cation symporter